MDHMSIVRSWNSAAAGLLVAAELDPKGGRRMRQLAAELQLLVVDFEATSESRNHAAGQRVE